MATQAIGCMQLVARIFSLPLILVGGAVLGVGLLLMVRAHASNQWPTAQGKVISRHIEEKRSQSNPGTRGPRNTTTYHARIRYEFVVNGETYRENRVTFADLGSSDHGHAWSVIKEYPEGKIVTVHYMPENPGVCVLEPGVKASNGFVLGGGLFLFAAGIAMFFFLPKLIAFTFLPKRVCLKGGNDRQDLADPGRS